MVHLDGESSLRLRITEMNTRGDGWLLHLKLRMVIGQRASVNLLQSTQSFPELQGKSLLSLSVML